MSNLAGCKMFARKNKTKSDSFIPKPIIIFLLASFKENMVVEINKDPTQTSPLTTSISVAYDAESPPGKGPKIGLALDLDI